MKIYAEIENEIPVLFVEGSIKSGNSDSLDEALEKMIKISKNFIVDLSKCELLTSAGVRVIIKNLAYVEKRDGDFSLRKPQKEVLNVLNLTGTSKIIEII